MPPQANTDEWRIITSSEMCLVPDNMRVELCGEMTRTTTEKINVRVGLGQLSSFFSSNSKVCKIRTHSLHSFLGFSKFFRPECLPLMEASTCCP